MTESDVIHLEVEPGGITTKYIDKDKTVTLGLSIIDGDIKDGNLL